MCIYRCAAVLYMQTLKLLNIIVFNNIGLCKHGRKVCYGFQKKNSLLQVLIESETLTCSVQCFLKIVMSQLCLPV